MNTGWQELQIRTSTGFGLADYPPGATFGPRTAPDFEFVWMVQGTARVWQDAVMHEVAPGRLLLTQPGMVDEFSWDPHQPTRHGFVHFSVEDPEGFLAGHSPFPSYRDYGEEHPLIGTLHHALSCLGSGGAEVRQLANDAVRLVLVSFLLGSPSAKSAWRGLQRPADLERALVCLTEIWASNGVTYVSLEKWAKTVGVSVGHLIRIFRTHAGMTPQKVQRRLRLEKASTLLRRTNLSVQEVAEASGFENPFHFSRVFKDETSLSPSGYRKLALEGKEVPLLALPHVVR